MNITEYHVGPGAYGVALAADGAAWTTLVERGELARVDPGDGQVSRVRLETGLSRPMVLALGSDGAIWFSRGDGRIGRVDPAGTVSSVPVATPADSLYGLCAGPDQTLWYTLLAADRIGRISPGGGIEEFPLAAGSMPSLITAGPGRRAMVHPQPGLAPSPESPRTATLRPIRCRRRTRHQSASMPPAKGRLVRRDRVGQIGRIFPDGRIEEFPLSDRSCRPHAIAATTDGGCWATLWAASSVVRIDRDGHLVEQATFPPGAEPHGIALAPRRNAVGRARNRLSLRTSTRAAVP